MKMEEFSDKILNNIRGLYNHRKDKAVMSIEAFVDKALNRLIADTEDSDMFYDIMDEEEY